MMEEIENSFTKAQFAGILKKSTIRIIKGETKIKNQSLPSSRTTTFPHIKIIKIVTRSQPGWPHKALFWKTHLLENKFTTDHHQGVRKESHKHIGTLPIKLLLSISKKSITFQKIWPLTDITQLGSNFQLKENLQFHLTGIFTSI